MIRVFPGPLKAFVLIITFCLLITGGIPAQAEETNLYIPDPNLRYLLQQQAKLTPADLAKIEKLDNQGKPIKDFTGMEYLINLKELTVSGIRLSDISFTADLHNLNRIDLKKNQITDLTPLTKLTKLQYLNLQENQITDIVPLKGLPNLLELNLETNMITDISPLSSLVKLTSLNLEDNKITNIDSLATLINLETLNLSNNDIERISALVTIDQNKKTGTNKFINLENNRLNLGEGSPAANDIKNILQSKRFIIRFEPQKVIQVKLNGTYLSMDIPPTIIEGRTLVPLRAIFEALDAQILWDDKSKKVTGTKGNTTVVLTINSRTAQLNGENILLDVPATIVDGRTMVPARFIAESLRKKVDWDDNRKTVLITD